ncbi:hypothetical protein [Actinomadura parmotrematis]|uniref:Histidine kinase n=1 Tax=Actinomadura parmotrematis TaxID=2864039 RepID=A0ABS7FRT1_9ACTN|nr:hypothetical protein [Actinomadura parmotrematis]MBW8483109.1 hypothetical protein [Actinomadura parmotrematis]
MGYDGNADRAIGAGDRTALAPGSAAAIAAARGGPVAGMLVTTALMTAVAFGLTLLVGRAEETNAARLALAAVEEERPRVAAVLDEGAGAGLDAIAAARPGDLPAVLSTARSTLATARAALRPPH